MTYSKYRAKKETVDGITFDSRKEASRYRQLKLMEKAKAIQDLQLQVKFPLIPKSKYGREVKYIADFVYDENGKTVVEDVKSVATQTDKFIIKRKLMLYIHGIKIRIV